ncbi:DNA adenine methylase, partial [bacterium]|nr:DNA adenine methylase [bacterium]
MISYIGGKSKMKNFIVPFIPKDMETYVEGFGGMFWIFFGMKLENYPNLKRVVYNDFNPLNYNLFRCVIDHQRLLEECNKLTVQEKGVVPTNPICLENFNKFQGEIYSDDLVIGDEPNYVVAAKYVYVLTQVFSGANPGKSKFIDLKGKYHSKFTSFKNKLGKSEYQKLFESITHVENLDFQDVIEKYDSPTTYFYMDPPYYIVGEGSYYSNHDFGREDHERLSNSLKEAEGKFSLSYYDFDLLHEWFPQDEYTWKRKEFVKAAAAKKGKKQTKGEELLI